MSTVRHKVSQLLEVNERSRLSSRIVNGTLILLIVTSVVELIIETEPDLKPNTQSYLGLIERVSIIAFSIEYVLRLWSVVESTDFRHPVMGRLKYALTPMAIIDLLAVLPAYIPQVLPYDLRVLRALRLFRVFRLFKLGRYVYSVRRLGGVLKQKASDIAVALTAAVLVLVIMSTLVFYAECDAQPQTFKSIGVTLWWGIVTLTTVGYGDMYPVTLWGRILGGIISVMGIGIVAIPAGIIASGYQSEGVLRPTKCPKCGSELD